MGEGRPPARVSLLAVGERTRASDADRHAAVELVEAAYADGQLSRAEFDDRLDAALKASRLTELDRLVADIQLEGEPTWRAGGRKQAGPAWIAAGNRKVLGPVVVALVLMTAALATVVIPRVFSDSDPDPVTATVVDTEPEEVPTFTQEPTPSETPSEEPVAITDPLTQDGLDEFMDAYEERFGAEAPATRVVLRSDRVEVVRPGPDKGTSLLYGWDGTWTGPESRKGAAQKFDFSTLSFDQINDPMEWARAELVEVSDAWVDIWVHDVKGREVCFTAHANDSNAGTRSTVAVNCHGKVIVRRTR